MKHIAMIGFVSALIALPAYADEPVMPKFEYAGQPLVLPDSDTSSLGQETDPHDAPFYLRCTDAATFNATIKRLKAKGMIVGIDALDKTLVMVFKLEDGSITFVRSDKQGEKLCIFGTVTDPDIDLGVVLGATDKNKF